MNILRGFTRWFLSLAVVTMLTAWVGLMVMQATILNRTAVQAWLKDSGIYPKVIDTAFSFNDPGSAQTESVVKPDDFKQALRATFPPSYIQQQSENVLAAIYDWVEGKKQTIAITIPINEKQDDFKTNTAKIIETKLATLPPCPTRINPSPANPTCIPQGMSAADLAARLTPELATEGGKFLDKPITTKELGLNDTSKAAWIPIAYANIKWLIIALPVGMLLAAAGFVLLSDDRLKGLSTISRRVLLNGLFLLIGGLALWQMGGSFSISNLTEGAGMSALLDPLIQQIVPSLGRTIAAISGAFTLISGISWGVVFFLRRRFQATTPESPPRELPKPPTGSPEPPKP